MPMMGRSRRSCPPLLLGTAVAACLVAVGLGLAVPQDADGVPHLRYRRSSNNSSLSDPSTDFNGRPLPPADGHYHGRGKQEPLSSEDVAFERSRRSSNSSSPPETPKDSNSRLIPPPDGHANERGKRSASGFLLRHSFSSGSPIATIEEHSNSGAARQKRSSRDELVSPAEIVETGVGRSRRSSNHSAPPRGPPPNSGRRGAGVRGTVAADGRRDSEKQIMALQRERRASNHSGPPKGPPPGRDRRQANQQLQDAVDGGNGQWDSALQPLAPVNGRERRASNHTEPPSGLPSRRGRRQLSQESPEDGEEERSLRQRRTSTSNSTSSDGDDVEDSDSSRPGRGPPPHGRPPHGGAHHGRGPPPRGCGGRRPPSGTNSTSTTTSTSTSTNGDTETLERFSRHRSRNRG